VLLEGRNAVIYGGGGAIGGAVARAFAGEGATVFLAGRTLAKLDEVAEAIRSAGGVAETIPAGFEGGEAIVEGLEELTMLGRTATLEDVGNVAAFVASDRARTMTAATVNISAGALVD